jgi:ribosomal-protein-alanine N-acetyltransferase
LELKHSSDLLKIFGDERVMEYYNLIPLKTISDAEKIILHFQKKYSDGIGIRWGIVLKGTENCIGTIGVNNYTIHHRGSIGYDLHHSYWNKGFVTGALQAIIEYAFSELGVNRIEAEVMLGNKASEKVLEKAGFHNEGVLREWMHWNDRYYDMTMFSLLKSEFVAQF